MYIQLFEGLSINLQIFDKIMAIVLGRFLRMLAPFNNCCNTRCRTTTSRYGGIEYIESIIIVGTFTNE